MGKMYVSPQTTVLDVMTESLLTQFSNAGEIEGPVGSKPHDSMFDFCETGEDAYPSVSVWDEE